MPPNLKSLYLDRTKIAAAVAAHNTECEVIGPKDCGKYHEYEIKQDGMKSAKLHIYNNLDDTTTLNYKVGANQEYSLAVAEHVSLSCVRGVRYEQKPMSIESISQEDWEFLIDFLRDEGYKVTEGTVPHGVRFDIWRAHGDMVNLNRYNTGRFLMQGKARELYGVVAATLCDLIPDKGIIVQAQLQSFSLDAIKTDDLLAELNQHTPSAVKLLGDATKAMIAPSLAFIKLNIELPDYSAYAYPALRGLEAYMKGLLSTHGYVVKNSAGLGSVFHRDVLLTSVRTKIGCRPTIDAIEKSYGLYNLHRPSLFHADGVPEMSRLIDTKEEAVTIVYNVLNCIESTSSAIPI